MSLAVRLESCFCTLKLRSRRDQWWAEPDQHTDSNAKGKLVDLKRKETGGPLRLFTSLHDLILLRTLCKVEYLSYLTSKKLLLRKDAITCGHASFVGLGGHHLLQLLFPFLSLVPLRKGFSSVSFLKINVNGPLLFSFPLIRWPHPLSCLAITYKRQLPTLPCTAWPCPRSTWPIHKPSAKTLMFITCAQRAQWAVPDWQRQSAGATPVGRRLCSAEGQDWQRSLELTGVQLLNARYYLPIFWFLILMLFLYMVLI